MWKWQSLSQNLHLWLDPELFKLLFFHCPVSSIGCSLVFIPQWYMEDWFLPIQHVFFLLHTTDTAKGTTWSLQFHTSIIIEVAKMKLKTILDFFRASNSPFFSEFTLKVFTTARYGHKVVGPWDQSFPFPRHAARPWAKELYLPDLLLNLNWDLIDGTISSQGRPENSNN